MTLKLFGPTIRKRYIVSYHCYNIFLFFHLLYYIKVIDLTIFYFCKGEMNRVLNKKISSLHLLRTILEKNIFDSALLLKRTSKHIKIVKDQYRRGLKDNPKYGHPPMIPLLEWNQIIEDAKEKRLHGKGIEPQ